MELRGQQDKVFGMPTTFGFTPPNRDINSSSSSKLSTINNTTIFINPPPHQTLDPHQHPNNLPPHNSTRDLDHHQNPDPNSSSCSPFVLTPNATATRAPNNSSGSNFKAVPPPALPQSSATSSRYRECLRNHAASSGDHVLDGCGEFMPSGDEDSPEGLKCAACECHRNFHRKVIDGGGDLVASSNYYVVNHQKHSSRRDSETTRGVILVPPPPSVGRHHSSGAGKLVPPMMMTFGGGGGGGAAESTSEDLNNMSNLYRTAAGQQAGASKKRFRTKFSQEQKEKMAAVAEKMGWRIQKHDEQDVQRLCAEVGIKRKVFKVWMHNNKQAMKKKEM